MSSLSTRMAQQELMDPNSPFYLGNPTPSQELMGYMYGAGSPYSAVRRNMYIGMPTEDRFESLQNSYSSRKKESLFKTIVVGAVAIYSALALRKVPGVKPAVKAVGSAIGTVFKGIGWVGRKAWDLIK